MATTTSINDENEEVNNSWQQSATQTSRHRAVPPTPQDTAIQNDVEAASRSQTNRPSVSTIEGEINNPNFNRNGERFNRDLLLQRNRLYVYNKLDNAQFGAFHFKMLFITGLGFFTDMYDLFSITLVMLMMTDVYCRPSPDNLPPGFIYCPFSNSTDTTCGVENSHPHQISLPSMIETSVKASSVVGIALGQFIFGILGDRYGRTRMYGIVLAIMVVGTFGSSFSASTVSGLNVFAVLIIWRFILGVGIGGDFPLSAIIVSEFANTKRRGNMIAAVFATQGLGILAQSFVTVITLAAFKSHIQQDPAYLDYVWRITLGLGTVPALIAIFSRIHIPETPRYTAEIDNDYERAAINVDIMFGERERRSYTIKRVGENRPTLREFCAFFAQPKQFKILLGTCVPRFALNVAFYGINLNSGVILEAIGFGIVPNDLYTTVFNNAVGQIVINLLGSIPGYFISVYLMEKMGRRRLQIWGFAILTVLYVILGSAYHQIRCTSMWLFIAIYILAQFFCNAGPNTTVFVIPAEVFPTKFRSTSYGISASIGKIGAAVSEIGFLQLKDHYGSSNSGLPLIILIFAGFMLIGFGFSFLLPETKGRTLEEINDSIANGTINKKKSKTFRRTATTITTLSSRQKVQPTNNNNSNNQTLA